MIIITAYYYNTTIKKHASIIYIVACRFCRDLDIQKPYSSGQAGSAFAMEPNTTSIGGRIACKPRAITVLAVPRLPEIAIPPISRSIAPSNRAVLIASCYKLNSQHQCW